ncbi:MAG: hypothetical protein APF76_01055 [Desulfitibacter sp. BRH_c19]|nr:MAG: hypothetical protein APF76_01055 [Desulfitibacter sp. BRH_c19]
MRKWRVGSMSMGVLLISLGVILLAALIKETAIITQILNWWPIVLIILGLEIVLYLFLAKDDQPKIKYDLVSIFLIIVLALFSIGVYTVSSIGVIPKITAVIASQEYAVVVPETRANIPETVSKVIIELPKASVSFKKGESDSLIVFARGEINAETKERAEDFANQIEVLTNQVGDVLFVQITDIPRARDLNLGVNSLSYTIFMPNDKQVEIKRQNNYYYYDTEIDSDAVTNTWLVENQGKVKLNVKSDNIAIKAMVNNQYSLGGNVEWDISAETEDNQATGNVSFGSGSNRINIINQGDVEVVYFE